MKFVTSVLSCCLTATAIASPIQVHYETEPSRATLVKEIFTTTYSIPEDLIGLKKVESCDAVTELGKLDLCLKNNGDLLVVSVDREFISESLKIFQAP